MKKDKHKINFIDNDGLPDEENPEWTEADFKSAKPFSELPQEMQDALLSLKKRGRPKIATPKRSKTFKLSADVIEGIMATGKGYNARVDAALRASLAEGRI
jgi:uncharacterized protein (DUF4415 family)